MLELIVQIYGYGFEMKTVLKKTHKKVSLLHKKVLFFEKNVLICIYIFFSESNTFC